MQRSKAYRTDKVEFSSEVDIKMSYRRFWHRHSSMCIYSYSGVYIFFHISIHLLFLLFIVILLSEKKKKKRQIQFQRNFTGGRYQCISTVSECLLVTIGTQRLQKCCISLILAKYFHWAGQAKGHSQNHTLLNLLSSCKGETLDTLAHHAP